MEDTSSLIKTMESELVKAMTAKAVAGLARDVWSGFGGAFFGGIAGQIISWVIAIGIKYGDWIAYKYISQAVADKQADTYEKKAETNRTLPATSTAKEKQDAEQAQKDAFDKLINMGGK